MLPLAVRPALHVSAFHHTNGGTRVYMELLVPLPASASKANGATRLHFLSPS